MKIFSFSTFLFILFACNNKPNNEVALAPAKKDSLSSDKIIKGPSYLSSLQFSKNYPTHETLHKIYDDINFHHACQAYLLTFPLMVKHNHDSLPPAGFPYWQMLTRVINQTEVNQQQLASFYKQFGIENGKPFNPTLEQKIILTEAAEIGFRMVQVIGLPHRWDTAGIYGGTKWKHALQMNAERKSHDFRSVDEQIVSALQDVSIAHELKEPGKSAYLFSAEDRNGQWLDGAKYYQLHIPKNIPAKMFWSITVYDNTTWKVIRNDEPRSSFNSKQPTYLANADGSVDVFFGSISPAGEGTNWIRTLPDKGWFVYLRLSEPTESFLNKSWPLEDIEEVSERVWRGPSKGQ